MSAPLSRRSFLAASAGLAVAAACGGKDSRTATPTTTAPAPFDVAVASSDVYAGAPNRFAFGIIKDGKPLNGATGVTVSFRPPKGAVVSAPPAAFHGDGLDDRGVYVTTATFATPGSWEAVVNIGTDRSVAAFPVRAKAAVPAPGEQAPRAPSPTAAQPLGVDPICTRNPPCPFHAVSLDQAIAAGKPVAVMFATPARCESRFCGPVLDLLIGAAPRYANRITFVHVEIYKNLTDLDPVPTLGPWRLESEPWLFGLDGTGAVRSRLDGAFDASEVNALLDGLVA